MYSLQFRYALSPLSPTLSPPRRQRFSRTFPPRFPRKLRVFSTARRSRVLSICCSSETGSQLRQVAVPENDDRPPFDINLAVILAGFSFEAYTTPPVCVPFCCFLLVLDKIEETFGISETVCGNSSKLKC